jgi:hypothetical protein
MGILYGKVPYQELGGKTCPDTLERNAMQRLILWLTLFALILASCAPVQVATPVPSATPLPTATATSTPAPTATPTVTPTFTPTPIPTIQIGDLTVPDPRYTNPELFDLTKPDAPIPQFVNAMKMAGIELVPEDVAVVSQNLDNYRLKTDTEGKSYIEVTCATKDTNGTRYTMGLIWEKRGGWREITPRFIDELNSKTDFGVLLNGQDYDNPHLSEIASVIWEQPFTRTWVEKYGTSQADKLIRLVAKNAQILYMHPGLWHLDIDSELKGAQSSEAVLSYVEKLADFYMSYAQEAHQQTQRPVLINFINEPWWADPPNHPVNFGWLESPYYKHLGKDYIIDAYVAFYKAGASKGLVPGKDFRLIVSVDGIFFPNQKLTMAISEVKRVKQEVARRLNLPEEQIQLDLDLEWRFDPNATGGQQSSGGYRLPAAEELQQALQIVKSGDVPFHITEFEVANVSSDKFNRIFQEFSAIAVEAGVKSITYAGLSHTDKNPYRDIRHALYEGGKPTSTYYAYLEILRESLNAK